MERVILRVQGDDVDYSFPSCGGHLVDIRLLSSGRCIARQEGRSNWSGDSGAHNGAITNNCYMANVSGTHTHALMICALLGLSAPDGEKYEDPAEHYLHVLRTDEGVWIKHRAYRCISRGYRVQ